MNRKKTGIKQLKQDCDLPPILKMPKFLSQFRPFKMRIFPSNFVKISNFGQILTLKWPPNTQKLEFLKIEKSQKQPSMVTIEHHKQGCICFQKNLLSLNYTHTHLV